MSEERFQVRRHLCFRRHIRNLIWFRESFDPTGYSVELLDPGGTPRATLDVTPNLSKVGGDPRRFVGLWKAGELVGQLSADLHVDAEVEELALDLGGLSDDEVAALLAEA